MIPNWFLHNFVDIVSVRSAYIFLEATVTSHTHTHTLLECCTLVQFTFVFHARMSINPFVSHLTPIFHNSRRGFAFLVFSFIFFFIIFYLLANISRCCGSLCVCLVFACLFFPSSFVAQVCKINWFEKCIWDTFLRGKGGLSPSDCLTQAKGL